MVNLISIYYNYNSVIIKIEKIDLVILAKKLLRKLVINVKKNNL